MRYHVQITFEVDADTPEDVKRLAQFAGQMMIPLTIDKDPRTIKARAWPDEDQRRLDALNAEIGRRGGAL